MQRILRFASLVFPVLALSCAEPAPEAAPAVKIAWISKGRCNSFFDISRFGARLASQDLAARGKAPVDVRLLEPDDCPDSASAAPPVAEECASSARQMAVLEQAIAEGFDALAISVTNPACIAPLLDRAVDAGIKVLTFDSDAAESRRHVHYGMDNRAAARVAVRALAEMLGGQGELAVQTSMTRDAAGEYQLSTSTSYVERMSGIEEELGEHPGLRSVATLPCIGNDVTDAACAAELEGALEEQPELAGFVLARGKVLRELELEDKAPALTEAVRSGRLHTVAFDAPDDALENIRAGYADLVIAQKQFGWGYDVVTLAYDMVSAGLEPPAFYDSGWYLVCPSNVDQYEAMWEAHDFRGELNACESRH